MKIERELKSCAKVIKIKIVSNWASLIGSDKRKTERERDTETEIDNERERDGKRERERNRHR